MVVSESFIGKDFEGIGHCLILRYCPGIRLGASKQNHEKPQ
jgi:hypothetical protein